MRKKTGNSLSLGQQMWASRYSYLLIAPFMIFFAIFVIAPIVASIALSFTDFNMLQTPNVVWFENYQRLIMSDDVFIIAVKNTLILALITGPVSYILCFFFAWLVNELPHGLSAAITVILYAPSISGNTYTVWQYILAGDRYGLLNGLLLDLGLITDPIQWLADTNYMLGATIIVQLWLSLGTSFLVHRAGLKGVDSTLYEAAAIDGVRNRFQEVWYVTLPSMKPQLLFAAVMQISAAFGVGAVQISLTGNPSTDYATHTIMAHIADYGTTRYELGYASAMASILLILMLMTNKVVNKVLRDD